MTKRNKIAAHAPSAKQQTPPSSSVEDLALQAMWRYYRDHKQELISNISEYRPDIVTALRLP